MSRCIQVGAFCIGYRPRWVVGRFWKAWGYSLVDRPGTLRKLVLTETEAMQWYEQSRSLT
jgi:hypothetical protein